MKEGGKRAVKLFQSEQEALDYISTKGNVGEVDVTKIWNTDHSPIVYGEALVASERIDLSKQQVFGCTDNCKCKKPSLLSRIIGFFKRAD